MQRHDIKPGTKIVAARPLAYSKDGQTIKYIEPGTPGTILRVLYGEGTWSIVETFFNDHIYQCDMRTAEFSFSTKINPIAKAG